MYLHVGQDTIVHTGDIVGVFDLDSTTLGVKTREFLAGAEKQGLVVNVSQELPKSFVVCAPKPGGKNLAAAKAVYISQLSAPTLKKRLDAGIAF